MSRPAHAPAFTRFRALVDATIFKGTPLEKCQDIMKSALSIARKAIGPKTGSDTVPGLGHEPHSGYHTFVAACPISRKLIGPEILRLNYKTSANILAAAAVLMDDAGAGHATSVIYDRIDPTLPEMCVLWSARIDELGDAAPRDEDDLLWFGEPAGLALSFTLQFSLCRDEAVDDRASRAMADHLAKEFRRQIETLDQALAQSEYPVGQALLVDLDFAGCVEVLSKGFPQLVAVQAAETIAAWKKSHPFLALDDIAFGDGWFDD